MEKNGEMLKPKHYSNSLNKFVQNTLSTINDTMRKSSIAQKIPNNWKELTILGTKRVETLFLEEKVEVVLATDEIFLMFHEKKKTFWFPKV